MYVPCLSTLELTQHLKCLFERIMRLQAHLYYLSTVKRAAAWMLPLSHEAIVRCQYNIE